MNRDHRERRALLIAAVLLCATSHAETRSVGLTSSGTRIDAAITGSGSRTVLLLGGLNGSDESAKMVAQEARDFEGPFRLIAIPIANPDRNKLVFPPTGVAYRDNPESHALWRWIAMQAPDLVLIAGDDDFGLSGALEKSEAGEIPARRVAAKPGILKTFPKEIPESAAHREIERRQTRSPRDVAAELAKTYGHDFAEPSYIPAIALIAQLRLGNLADVERIVEPFADGSKNSLARPNSPGLAGHLIFAALAERTADPRYVKLVRKVADLGFDESGEMKESMPLHDEMSDSVFMGCPILAKAGKLTGEQKYFNMSARHFRFMATLDRRPDGIYRHSPLSEAAWGRGNAFPALGLALTLADFPADHHDFPALLAAFRAHMAALSKFQDADGMWHEVIDEPASYAEFSATAMIATAMLMGVRHHWLDESYQARVDRAWRAIARRIGPEGRLMDVCESTGKQKSLADYLRRAAIAGQDPRGGAMAMLFATEMAGLP